MNIITLGKLAKKTIYMYRFYKDLGVYPFPLACYEFSTLPAFHLSPSVAVLTLIETYSLKTAYMT